MTENLQAERLASNQTLFRHINEEMLALNKAFAARDNGDAGFVCECSRLDCVEHIEITLANYVDVRSNARWFLVAPSEDHVFPQVETVIARTDHYFIVEKTGVAGEVAEQAAETR
jgi:hypothetical protein